MKTIYTLCLALVVLCAAAGPRAATPGQPEVLVYAPLEDGSIMHWLAISPLHYNVKYLGDSMSADVLHGETTARPRNGDRVQGPVWHKMHYSGCIQGPTVCELFNVSGDYFEYGITANVVYLYLPTAHPHAIFAGSSDDGLKVILNGQKIWSNQIQRSPTYDSDQAPAPLRAGWNTLLVIVDQVWGGHLLCARFLEADKPLTDLQIALDPPADDARRYPADTYNRDAAALMKQADAARQAGKLDDALAACDNTLAQFPLAEVAPRAAYVKAGIYDDLHGQPSLRQSAPARQALEELLARYGQDVLAEYALLDLAQLTAADDAARAETLFRSMEDRYPQSTLAPRAQIEVARLLAAQAKYEDSLLTYRKILKKYPKSDEVMTATVGIADTYRLAGEAEKARAQYLAARALAQDWHDNKYGVDVGKQAWLAGILDDVRQRLETK